MRFPHYKTRMIKRLQMLEDLAIGEFLGQIDLQCQGQLLLKAFLRLVEEPARVVRGGTIPTGDLLPLEEPEITTSLVGNHRQMSIHKPQGPETLFRVDLCL